MEKERRGGADRPFFYDEKKKTQELLAPAGNYETFTDVIRAGADSVYVGARNFSARAYADNFSADELLRAIDYAHLHGVKLHLALNTCMKPKELEAALGLLEPLYEAGLDAVIVQDIGLFSRIRVIFPDLPIHASTQMGIAGSFGASYLKQAGASRVILARELSLEEIAKVKNESGLEVEVFVHGALCYSVSGQCLMSSMIGGRSANRGRCAGPCRLPYILPDGKEKGYPLSLKDLCALECLPALISAGVDAFKIEGRQKAGSYAATVTKIYRKYLDLAISDPDGYRVEEKDLETLMAAGNRSGFTSSYLTKRGTQDMVSFSSPAHTTEKSAGERTERAGEDKQKIKVKWVLRKQEPVRLTLSFEGQSVTAEGTVCEKARKAPLTEMSLKEKTGLGGSFFCIQEFSAEMEDDIFLPVQEIKRVRRQALQLLTEQLMSPFRRSPKTAELPVDMTPYEWKEPFFSAFLSDRRQLPPVLHDPSVRRIYLDCGCYRRDDPDEGCEEDVRRIRDAGKEAFYSLPPFLRDPDAGFYGRRIVRLRDFGVSGFLAGSYDALALLLANGVEPQQIHIDQSLYTWSDTASSYFLEAGFSGDTIPYELSEKELRHRRNERSELVVYGRLPLMQTAGCLFRTMGNCTKTGSSGWLTDRLKKRFFVRSFCGECRNTIYNCDVLNLLSEEERIRALRPASLRFIFTSESADEVKKVLSRSGASDTKGHFHRGVD